MIKLLIGLACTTLFGLLVSAAPNSASARTRYLARFVAKYGERIDEAAIERCAICHGGRNGATKTIRSEYADAFFAQIEAAGGDRNCTDDAIIDAALTAVEAVESDPEDEDGPTYGEILAEGNLPPPAAEQPVD